MQVHVACLVRCVLVTLAHRLCGYIVDSEPRVIHPRLGHDVVCEIPFMLARIQACMCMQVCMYIYRPGRRLLFAPGLRLHRRHWVGWHRQVHPKQTSLQKKDFRDPHGFAGTPIAVVLVRQDGTREKPSRRVLSNGARHMPDVCLCACPRACPRACPCVSRPALQPP